MIRQAVVSTAVFAFVGLCASPASAGPQERGATAPPPVYADAAAQKRIREALVQAPAGALQMPSFVPDVTFTVHVFGSAPLVPPFQEWLAAALADPNRRYVQQGQGVDVLPFIKSALKHRREERARRQVAEELAAFLRAQAQIRR